MAGINPPPTVIAHMATATQLDTDTLSRLTEAAEQTQPPNAPL